MTDDLLGYLVDDVTVLVDDSTGDVGVRVADSHVIMLSADLARELGADLLEATRRESRAVTPAQWAARC